MGDYLATASADQSVRLWDATTGSLVSVLNGYTHPVWAVAFSPDGTVLATGGADRIVQLRTVQTKQVFAEFRGHNNLITSLRFSPNGQLLASSSEDGTVRLWKLDTGECLAVLSSARPYERMDITGTYGITPAEKSALQELGAIEHSPTENK
jgi:WD40 repeat protein